MRDVGNTTKEKEISDNSQKKAYRVHESSQ